MTRFATRLGGALLHRHPNLVLPPLSAAITIAGVLDGPGHNPMDLRTRNVICMSPREVVHVIMQWMLMMPLCLGHPIHRRNRFLRGDPLYRMTCQGIRGQCLTRTMMVRQEVCLSFPCARFATDECTIGVREARDGTDSRHRPAVDSSSRFGFSRDRLAAERHGAEQITPQASLHFPSRILD